MKNNCINLDLIYKDPNLKRLIHFGVNIGAIKHISLTYDINEWKQCRKRAQKRGMFNVG